MTSCVTLDILDKILKAVGFKKYISTLKMQRLFGTKYYYYWSLGFDENLY